MAEPMKLILDSDPSGATFALGGRESIIGRAPDCDVVLDAPTVSGRHGLLRYTERGWTFTDLDSRNGSAVLAAGQSTPVPAMPGRPMVLGPGDALLLGTADSPARLRLESAPSAFAAPVATDRTVIATAPLANLLQRTPDGLVELAARALSAPDARSLADAALAYLDDRLDGVDGRAALITGAGLNANAGDPPPDGLFPATQPREVVLCQREGGSHVGLLIPLLAGDGWHGHLLAWSHTPAALPRPDELEGFGVAGSLVALSAATLAVRAQGEAELQRARETGDAPADPVGESPAFREALELARTVAPATVPVLILGETGTGKEVLARFVHRASQRARGPFVAFNCAAVPDTLLESELFGHVRGAFTGAGRDKPGLFEAADGGTVFLDEIGEMPPAMQAKLLRVLQDGEVRRVGSTRATRVDVRVISATHRDLRSRVEAGAFRSDLMYRLNAVTVRLPALRDRGDDVGLLAHVLLGRACTRERKRITGLSPEALTALASHSWPGNVRELENELVRAVALTPTGRPVEPAAFSPAVRGGLPGPAPARRDPDPITLRDAVEAAERRAVDAALEATDGNMSQAARRLGLTRPGFYKVMDRLGMRK